MGLSIKEIHDPLIFCADRIDIITNFAVITNVVVKRVHFTLNQMRSLMTGDGG